MNWYKIAKIDHLYTKSDMIRMGADGYLSEAMLVYIPLSKITGRDPVPRTFVDESGEEREFKKGRKITAPIEVLTDDLESFALYAGNHRVRQAEVNGQEYILAFVECSSGNIDDYSKLGQKYELV